MNFKLQFIKKVFRHLNIIFSLSIIGFLFFLAFIYVGENGAKAENIKTFLSSMEAKTFDMRQSVIAKKRKASNEIVVVGVDNVSQEYLINYFGTWPMPRHAYADFINYIEMQKPIVVGIDVIFVNPWKKNKSDDILLADTCRKYDNVFSVIYFDDYPLTERAPAVLPKELAAKINSESKNFSPFTYPNSRNVFPELISRNSKFGHMNIERAEDGVIRKLPLFVKYPKYKQINDSKDKYKVVGYDYYPNFGLKVLLKYLDKKNNYKSDEFNIDKYNNLHLGTVTIPMEKSGEAVLNWYGGGLEESYKTFNYVSFKDVFEDMQAVKLNKKRVLPKDTFKNKIVIMGFTADGLSDLKTVPNYKLFPGMEIYTTFINNVIDGNLIKKASPLANLLISAFLMILVVMVVLRVKSATLALFVTTLVTAFYTWFSFFIMEYYNIWIYLVVPILTIAFTFTVVYFLKYILKEKDYEYVYELATVDSLTDLHNHRFFQEQLAINIEYSKRYGQMFSLILIDIDNFKKFNDNYGHQSGDAVLRQVAILLKNAVRKADIVCRYGGEEIVIILPSTDNANAYILAEKLCKLVSNKIFELKDNVKTNVTISIGVATYPDNAELAVDLVEYADKSLYVAKSNGRNQVGKLK